MIDVGRRMGSCIVVTRFAPSQPGYLDFAYRIQSLATRYQVTVISDHQLEVPEMRIEGVAHVSMVGDGEQCGLGRYLWRCARYVRSARPDFVILLHTLTAPLIYALGGTPNALYWNEHAIRFLATSPCSTLRRVLRQKRYEWTYMAAVKRADLVMPIGEAHRDDLIACGCQPERVRMIYMGVDDRFSGVALQRSLAAIEKSLEVVYTGSVKKERGRDVMLEAVAKARARGVPVRLTMVGAQSVEQHACLEYARKLGIEDGIVIHGRVPGHEIPNFIANADAGICIWEDSPWNRFNPPTKLFEYLVAGLPVLASNIRTHTQYVVNEENGLIFEYDSESLADALLQLWERRSNLQMMRQAAWESGRRHLWSAVEPEFLGSVASLMRSRV